MIYEVLIGPVFAATFFVTWVWIGVEIEKAFSTIFKEMRKSKDD